MAESTSSTNSIAALNALNLVAYIANVGFVNAVPALFNVPDNGELSRKYQTIVTPAGWAFAIWGLIFLVQAIWSVIQVAVPSYRTNPLVVKGVDYNYLWVCLFQIGWTFAFGFERITLSLVFMLGILFFLIRIYSLQQKTLIENNDVAFSRNYWLLRFPFGIHLGWIIAATLVNINVVLVALGASARFQFYAAMLSLVITLVVTAGSLFNQADKRHPDVVIPLVLVWALYAIAKELKDPKELIMDTFSQPQIDTIQNSSATAAIVVTLSVFFIVARSFWRHRSNRSSEEEHLLNE